MAGEEVIVIDSSSNSSNEGGGKPVTKTTSTSPQSNANIPFKKRKCEATATSSSALCPTPKISPMLPTLVAENSHLNAPDFALSEFFVDADDRRPPVLQPQVTVPQPSPPVVAIPSTSKAATAGLVQNVGNPDPSDSFNLPGKRRVRISDYGKAHDQLINQVHQLKKAKERVVESLKKEPLHQLQRPGVKLINELRSTSAHGERRPAAGTRRRRRSSGEHRILEQEYAQNPNPSPSDFLEMELRLKIPRTKIKKFYSSQRYSRIKIERTDPGVVSEGRRSSTGQNNGIREGHAVESGSVGGLEETGSNPGQTPINYPEGCSRPKLKFVKHPSVRNMNVVKDDIEKVKDCDMQVFRGILETIWDIKADRIYRLAKTSDASYSKVKDTLRKEARRLKEINADVSPLSPEQSDEVKKWETRFKEKHRGEAATEEERMELGHILKEFVRPWLEPFMYGRITAQDGRLLTLEVALHDFSKASRTGKAWKWETPEHLQTDLFPVP